MPHILPVARLSLYAFLGSAIALQPLAWIAAPTPLLLAEQSACIWTIMFLALIINAAANRSESVANYIALAAILAVPLFVATLHGAPAIQIVLYLLVGMIGGATAALFSGRVASLLLVLVMTILVVVQALSTHSIPANTIIVASILFIVALVGCCSILLPEQSLSDDAFTLAITLIGFGCLAMLWQSLTPLDRADWTGLIVAFVVLSIGLVIGFRHWYAPWWSKPIIQTWLLEQELAQLDRPLTLQQIDSLGQQYLAIEPSRRLATVRQLIIARPDCAALLLAIDSSRRQVGDVHKNISVLAQRHNRMHARVVRMLYESVSREQAHVWQQCFELLGQMDPQQLEKACWRAIHEGHPQVMIHYLATIPLALYRQTLRALLRSTIDTVNGSSLPRTMIIEMIDQETQVEDVLRAASAVLVLRTVNPQIIIDLLTEEQTHGAPKHILITLEQAAKDQSSAKFRNAICTLIAQGASASDQRIWQECLLCLVRLDLDHAVAAVQQRLMGGDFTALIFLFNQSKREQNLSRAESITLAQLLLHLCGNMVIAADQHAAAACDFLLKQYQHTTVDIAAMALLELARIKNSATASSNLPERINITELYQKRKPDGITQSLLLLAQLATLRSYVIAILLPALKINPSVAELAQLNDPQQNLQELLFPFRFRKAHEQGILPQIEEAMNEPVTSITGQQITVWAYQTEQHITDIVIAGHANAPVCRNVSGKLYNAFLQQGAVQGDQALFIPGAFVLRTAQSTHQDSAQLTKLIDELNGIGAQTGLVQVRMVDHAYTDVVTQIQHALTDALRLGQSMIHRQPDQQQEDCAIALPFYTFTGQTLEPLSIELPMNQLTGPIFEQLLAMHRQSIGEAMIADALRRKGIYEDWHRDHTARLRILVRDILLLFHMPNTPQLIDGYVAELCDPQLQQVRAQRMYQWVQAIFPRAPLRPLEELTSDEIAQILADVLRGLPEELQDTYMRIETLDLRDYIRRTNPQLIPSDAVWEQQLTVALKRDIPIRGEISWAKAQITVDPDQVIEWASLIRVMFNMPSIIHQDTHWIEQMNNLLTNINESILEDKKYFDTINLGTFLDAFLRGWPPVFLAEKAQQQIYNQWSAERREPVWKAIHQLLLARGLRMDPLCEDNVAFAIRQINSSHIRIMPFFITSNQECMILLHQHVGITHYLYPWQYRQRINNQQPAHTNNQLSQDLCTKAVESLANGDITMAAKRFTQALRYHPAQAASTIFTEIWRSTRATTLEEAQARLDLAQAAETMFNNRMPQREAIQRFVDRFPLLIPDAYLMLFYCDHELAREITKTGAKLETAVHEYSVLQFRFSALQSLGSERGHLSINLRNTDTFSPLDLNRLNQLFTSIQASRQYIDQLQRKLWASLAQHNDPNRNIAKTLDLKLVEDVTTTGQLRLSERFRRYISPLLSIRQAEEYMHIDQQLAPISSAISAGQDDSRQMPAHLHNLQQSIEQIIQNDWLDQTIVEALHDLYIRIEQSNITPIISSQIYIQLQDIRERLSRFAFEAISASANSLPEITGPRKQFTHLQYLNASYAETLNVLASNDEIPLQCAFASAKYTIVDAQPFQITQLRWAADQHSIIAQEEQDHWRTLLRIDGLSDAESALLQSIVEQQRLRVRLNTATIAPVYALLHHPIKIPDITKHWKLVVQQLTPQLIWAMAYLGTDPIGEQPSNELLHGYNKQQSVLKVEVRHEQIEQHLATRYIGLSLATHS